ncbi:MAG TPA: hypothetical protein VEB66_14205 [Opitutaceae bacterium]|nr:hypothetical protein [Opitutaceae bacterium]
MKKSILHQFVPALCALALASAAPAWAQAEKGRKPSKETLAKYDADRDGKLNDEEQARWDADIAAKARETRRRNLEKYDADGDGKLDEAEKEKRKSGEAAEKEAAATARRAEKEANKKK